MGFFTKKAKGQAIPISSLTAGGTTYNAASYTDATYVNQLRQVWQQAVYDIYDTEGHLFYATNYIGGAMSRIRLVAAKRNPEDGLNMRPTILATGPVTSMVRNIRSATGGQSGFLRQIGRNVFLVGEAWVVASDVGSTDGNSIVAWDACSIDEIQSGGNGNRKFMRKSLPGAQPELLPEGSSVYRVWKEHPRYSKLADAGARSCLELLEKIIVLNRAEKAIARSQLAGSGILALPQELVPPAWQNQDKVANPMEANPLWAALAESMTAPLRDPSAPSAVVPLLLVGPGDQIGKMKYEPLARSFNTAASQASVKNAIEQIANTLEIPKEILLGVGEATHWTAWSIREDVFQAHVQPLIELVCDSLSRTFLRESLRKLSLSDPVSYAAVLADAGVTDPDDLIVWYDASQLVILPDKADKVSAAHDRLVVTDAYYAEANGIPKEALLDKSSDEYAKRIGVKMVDPQMAISGKPPAGDPGKLGGVAVRESIGGTAPKQ